MARRRKKNSPSSKTTGRKSGMPAWVKPTVSMIIGGGVGLVAMNLLPEGVAPYAPALGVLGSKFIGGGSWGKYGATAAVVGGVTFLSRRKSVQIASGALTAAKRQLASGGGSAGGGSAAAKGDSILRKVGG